MQILKRMWLPLGVLGSLAACGGGGSGGRTADVTQEPLFIGAAPGAETSTSGVPFAEEGVGVIITDVDLNVPVISAPVTPIKAVADTEVSGSTFTPSFNYLIGLGDTFDIIFEGETVSIVDGEAILDDGRRIVAEGLTKQGGAHLVGYAVESVDGFESISALGFVQETAPADVAARGGVSSYTGPFRLLTASYVDQVFIEEGVQRGFLEIGTSLDGTATLIVDFSDGTLSGVISEISFGGDTGTLTGEIAQTAIVGNGAVGSVAWSCGDGAVCTDQADLGMVIGRSDASTILGMTSIDTDITLADDAEVSITGVGGFIVER